MKRLILTSAILLLLVLFPGQASSGATPSDPSSSSNEANESVEDEIARITAELQSGDIGWYWEGKHAERLAELGEAGVPGLIYLLQHGRYASNEASRYLQKVGAPAVPLMMEELRGLSVDERLRLVAALEFTNGVGVEIAPFLIESLEYDAPSERPTARISKSTVAMDWENRAVRDARFLGKLGEPALPLIREALVDCTPAVEDKLLEALGMIGAPAIEDIAPYLSSDDPLVRKQAVVALGYTANFGPPPWRCLGVTPEVIERERLNRIAASRRAVPLLVDLLKDEDAAVRLETVEALFRFGDWAWEALDAMLGACFDSDAEVRRKTVWRLKMLNADTPAVIEKLRLVAGDPDERVQEAAMSILLDISNDAPETRALVRNAVESGDSRSLSTAAWMMPWDDEFDREIKDRLLADLLDTDSPNHLTALRSIRSLVPPPPEALPFLIAAIEDDYSKTAGDSMDALQYYGPDAAPAIPALIKALGKEKRESDAVRALAAIGESVIPHVEEALRSDNPTLRNGARGVIYFLDVYSQAAVESSFEAVHSGKKEYPDDPERTLEEVKHVPAEAVPYLIQRLEDGIHRERYYACRLLGLAGESAEPAVPLLKSMLEKDPPEMSKPVIEALGGIGPAAAPAAPLLVEMMNSESWEVGLACAKALNGINPDSDRAYRFLLRHALDEQQDLKPRREAAWALYRMPLEGERRFEFIRSCLNSDNDYMLEAALRCAAETGADGARLLPDLLEAFHARWESGAFENEQVIVYIPHSFLKTFREIGLPDEQASSLVLELLGSSNRHLVAGGANYVSSAGLQDPRLIEPLLKMLDSDRESFRTSAVKALAGFETPDPRFTARLESLLNDRSQSVRVAARKACEKLESPGSGSNGESADGSS